MIGVYIARWLSDTVRRVSTANSGDSEAGSQDML